MQCEAVLLGRSPADGALDAASLASLVRTLLVSRSFASRRYQIRCQDALEFRPQRARRRRVDDEGFESDNDDDSSSTKSLGSDDTVSNSSSCCLVEDHVFKTGATLPNTGAASDSANSSGASDTDDLDYHKNGVAATPAAFQRSVSEDGAETFPISEVVFCHTDSQFPKVAVWVVKKPGLGLETLVFECKNSENLKKLCSTFQEVSRRSKLDQFTHTNRRKDVTTTLNKNVALSKAVTVHKLKDSSDSNSSSNTATSKSTTNSRSSGGGEKGGPHASTSTKSTNSVTSTNTALTPLSSVLVKSLAPPTAPKPLQQTIIRTLKDTTDAITQFSKAEPTPSFPKVKPPPPSTDVLPLRAVTKPMRAEEIPPMSRFNLVQRTDGDGVTHIEISRGIREDADADAQDASGPSSILSIHTPDVGNFQGPKSRFSKEIESVIRSDLDSAAGPKKDVQRQRQPAILVLPENSDSSLRKVWTSTEDAEENPPMRPERRRYVKKKGQAPDPPKQAEGSSEGIKLETLKVKGTQVKSQPKIVKGQFIRVSVDQPQSLVMPVIQTGGWGYSGGGGGGSLVAYSPAPWATTRRKSVEDIFQASHRYHHQPKTRTYRSKSPPARPMAYRYIDTVPQSSSTLTKRLFGVSQKLRELGGSHYATSSRRRNSIGELAYTAQQNSGNGGNLKSVIKKGNKSRMGEYQEPKKVTFSAYATVQVVD